MGRVAFLRPDRFTAGATSAPGLVDHTIEGVP